jgi:hypothetical protein
VTERPPQTDSIELHPDYLPEPEFFDDDEGDEDAAPAPVDDDRDDD